MIGSAVRATLDAVAAALANEVDDWWIIGSAAVALHGVSTKVADIDVLTSAAAARRLAARLGIDPVERPSERFRSVVFVAWSGMPLPVEVMGDLSVRTAGTWDPVLPATRTRAGTDDGVYIPSRADLATILHRFGRPKDLARAAMLVG